MNNLAHFNCIQIIDHAAAWLKDKTFKIRTKLVKNEPKMVNLRPIEQGWMYMNIPLSTA